MKTIYAKIKKELISEIAAAKLFIIRYGLNIDGIDLERRIEGYPERYRTKRSIKNIGIQDNCLVDREKRDVPWIPEEIFIMIDDKESVVKTNYKPDALFQLEIKQDQLIVHAPELGIQIPCRLSPRQDIFEQSINGFPADQYVQVIGSDRLSVLGYDGCANWFYKTQCLFCDSCAVRPDEVKARPSLNDLHVNFADSIPKWLAQVEKNYLSGLAKAFRLVLENKGFGPHCHLLVMAGNLMDMHHAWEYILRLSATLSREKPLTEIDSYLNMLPPPNIAYIDQAYKTGFKNLIFNLEVFGEKFFKAVCKGKHDLVPYNQFIDRMNDAAAIFGSGHARCGFVLGAQPVDVLKEGVLSLAQKGVVSDYSVFTPKKGTPWERRKQPDILEVASFSRFLAGIYHKYHFKPLYCSMSSRSSIMNECYEATCDQ